MTEGFWWAALAIAGASAVAHLFSMLGTRWGDRGASSKALLFSLLLHLSLFFGLFAVGPQLDRIGRSPDPLPQEEPEPIEIREIVAEPGEERTDELTATPLWDRPIETATPRPNRIERSLDLPAAAETSRTLEPLAAADPAIPAPVDLPEMVEQAPTVAEAAVPQLEMESRPLEITEETAEARSEERPPLARTERTPLAEAGEEMEPERAAAPAAADRLAKEFDPRKQLADLRTTDAPANLPETLSPADPLTLEQPTAPAPLPSETMAGAGDIAEGTTGDAPLSERFSRRPTQSREFAGGVPEAERGAMERSSPGEPSSGGRDLAMSRLDHLRASTGDLPSLSRPDTAPLPSRQAGIPETYQLRRLDRRSEIARQHGGTEGSEQAVELSLKWLAANQHSDGYWDADAHGAGQVEVDEQGIRRNSAGKTADSGLTALAVLAFLGAGYTHEEGEYADTVDRALTWLIENQRDDGFLGYGAAHFEQMYCHGMATYALAEAYGMQADASNTRLRRPLEKAVLYIAAMQHRDGGWRYVKGQAGDMSMFGWQLMALKSAEIAGVPMPENTRTKMVQFLRERSLGESGGLAAYRKTDPQIPPTPAMTAEALFCKQILGITRTNPASIEAVSYLLKHTPKRSELNYYYWYYGTLAMFQYGGSAWEHWNASLRDLLVAEQIKTGPNAGSWAPRDAWGPYGGRVYSTTVATLSLEVYYRFLPLYRAVELPASNSRASEPTAER